MRGRCMLNRPRPIDGLPTKLIIWAAQVVAGGYTYAVWRCCTDRAVVRGLRPVREAGRRGVRTAACRGGGQASAGRRRGTRQIRMQRRDHFNLAGSLPGQHGARPATAVTVRRTAATQSRLHDGRYADRLGAVRLDLRTSSRCVALADIAARSCSASALIHNSI